VKGVARWQGKEIGRGGGQRRETEDKAEKVGGQEWGEGEKLEAEEGKEERIRISKGGRRS